jgi:hypothetical protein
MRDEILVVNFIPHPFIPGVFFQTRNKFLKNHQFRTKKLAIDDLNVLKLENRNQ